MALGISQHEWARRKGVSVQAVNKRIRKGTLSCLADRSLDPEVAEREWSATREPYSTTRAEPAPAKPVKEAAGTYATARTHEAVFRAKMKQVDYEQRAGLLVRSVDVEDKWSQIGRALRSRLMSLPQRLAAELAGTTSPLEVRVRLDAELREALRDVAADLLGEARGTPEVRPDFDLTGTVGEEVAA